MIYNDLLDIYSGLKQEGLYKEANFFHRVLNWFSPRSIRIEEVDSIYEDITSTVKGVEKYIHSITKLVTKYGKGSPDLNDLITRLEENYELLIEGEEINDIRAGIERFKDLVRSGSVEELVKAMDPDLYRREFPEEKSEQPSTETKKTTETPSTLTFSQKGLLSPGVQRDGAMLYNWFMLVSEDGRTNLDYNAEIPKRPLWERIYREYMDIFENAIPNTDEVLQMLGTLSARKQTYENKDLVTKINNFWDAVQRSEWTAFDHQYRDEVRTQQNVTKREEQKKTKEQEQQTKDDKTTTKPESVQYDELDPLNIFNNNNQIHLTKEALLFFSVGRFIKKINKLLEKLSDIRQKFWKFYNECFGHLRSRMSSQGYQLKAQHKIRLKDKFEELVMSHLEATANSLIILKRDLRNIEREKWNSPRGIKRYLKNLDRF